MRLINGGLVRASYAVILILGLVLNAGAEDRSDSLLKVGRDLAYNAQFAEAESLFTEAARTRHGRGGGDFEIAQIRLWIYAGVKTPQAFANFILSFDTAVVNLKNILKENPGDFTIDYLLGEAYMLRAIAGVTAHSYADAFWAVKSAAGYYEKTLALNPEFYDAYRGVGEIHYFLDFLPGGVKWLIPLFGLKADKAKGFSEIRLAYEKGTRDRVKSALSLAQVYSNYVAEYDSAGRLMRALVARFPRNPMFNYHLAVVLIKERRLHEAEKYLDVVLDVNDPDFTVLNDLTLFLKGDVHFKMNDFRNAIKYNEMFLSRTREPDYTGIANYRLAVSYRAIGDSEMMKKCLSAALHGNEDIYDDARAKYRSETFLRKGISDDELKTLEMKNDVEAGLYEDAYAGLVESAGRMRDRDTRAEALVVLSEAAIGLGKYSEASRFAGIADSIDHGGDNWIEPRSWYLVALSSYRTGNLTRARDYLSKARDTDEYKSNNILNELVNNLEEKLKAGKS